MIAIAPTNGFEVSRAKLHRNDRFLEENDRWPVSLSLADFGYRAQQAHEFYETWLTEVSAGLIAGCGHRIQAGAPAQAQVPLIAANNTQGGSQGRGLLSQALLPAQQQPAQQQPAQQLSLTAASPAAQSATNTTIKPLEENKE